MLSFVLSCLWMIDFAQGLQGPERVTVAPHAVLLIGRCSSSHTLASWASASRPGVPSQRSGWDSWTKAFQMAGGIVVRRPSR